MADANLPGRAYGLSLDQAVAVEKVATSGRVLDVLVGPAGTGKSTTMAGVRAAWEAEHGPGSVVGLAPSAAAAEVLAQELGIPTENTAKWLTEWRRVPELVARRRQLAERLGHHPRPFVGRCAKAPGALAALDDEVADRQLRPGQLVVVDEASLAGTFSLDELVSAAKGRGPRCCWPGTGRSCRPSTPAGRSGSWSATGPSSPPADRGAAVPPRVGEGGQHRAAPRADRGRGTYEAHGRVSGGGRTEMLERLYEAWKADVAAGKSSLMIAPDAATVAELNRRARAGPGRRRRGPGGRCGARGRPVAGVGDVVVTRENNRLLGTAKSWVKNGDRWTVTGANEDGSMALRRLNGNGEVVLPPVCGPPRGAVLRHDCPPGPGLHRGDRPRLRLAHHHPGGPLRGRHPGPGGQPAVRGHGLRPRPGYLPRRAGLRQSPTEVLVGVLARAGADLSAHEVRDRAARQAESWAVLAQEYTTIAQEAQRQRFDEMLTGCGSRRTGPPRRCGKARRSGRSWHRCGSRGAGLNVGAVLPRLVQARGFDDAADPAAVLHGRVQRWAAAAASKRREPADLVAGLLPEPPAWPTPTCDVLWPNVTRPWASERENWPRKP